jgi:hypothetical protein
MDSRSVSRRALLTSFFATGAAAAAMAQDRIVRPIRPDGTQVEPLVLSGSDIGFRVDHEGADGATGALVVKLDGKWVDAKFSVGLRRATESR